MIIIDRFEGETAVLETDKGMIDAERSLIPDEAGEGDVLYIQNGVYLIDHAATEKRKASIAARFNRLKRRNVEND